MDFMIFPSGKMTVFLHYTPAPRRMFNAGGIRRRMLGSTGKSGEALIKSRSRKGRQ
jgi:hypothetical protein